MTVSLDATYSLGDDLSGVGVYSRAILNGLAEAHPECGFRWYYRWRRFWRAPRPRKLLHDVLAPTGDLFHGLNQRLPRRLPKRAVTTFHDLFVITGEYSTPEFRRRFREQARHAAENSDLILTVSAFTARQVRELLGVEPGRVRVIHHGCGAAGRGPALPREKLVLHVGAIQKRKNIARLVKAFEAVDPEWRLALVGSQGYGAGHILQAVQNSSARDRILLTGYVPAPELPAWYARASVFAFPSLDEGFGMPVLEAMAAGVPVITSNRSALPEVAGDAAILIDPEDTRGLADALKHLTENGEARDGWIVRGLARAAQFSWANTVASTWGAYQEILR